jgi:hypothetical protein
LSGETHFRFEVSSAIRDQGFVPACVALGTDYSKAIAKVDSYLLPRLRAFQTDSTTVMLPDGPVPGTIDELIHVYKTEPTSTFLTNNCNKSQKKVAAHLTNGANHVYQTGPNEGRRVGSLVIRPAILTP